MDKSAFRGAVLRQAALHPALQSRDLIKLCYQAAFGAEHLLSDTARAGAYFREEYAQTPETAEALTEVISSDMARVNLGAWKASKLPPEWLFSLFLLSSGCAQSEPHLRDYFAEVSDLTVSGLLPVSSADWERESSAYLREGIAPVHHSEHYRQTEHPRYRLVTARLCKLIPILRAVSDHIGDGVCVLALDGRAASGKTTAAAALASILGAGVVHMDDFFLPPQLRTEERLGQPGGNVHYERVSLEVIPKLPCADAFSYRRFDCETMEFGTFVTVPASGVRIVEGSYSLHPNFGSYADISVFCDVTSEEQYRRILQRNGPAMLRRFETEWIPMEETYFRTYGVPQHAMLTLS